MLALEVLSLKSISHPFWKGFPFHEGKLQVLKVVPLCKMAGKHGDIPIHNNNLD